MRPFSISTSLRRTERGASRCRTRARCGSAWCRPADAPGAVEIAPSSSFSAAFCCVSSAAPFVLPAFFDQLRMQPGKDEGEQARRLVRGRPHRGRRETDAGERDAVAPCASRRPSSTSASSSLRQRQRAARNHRQLAVGALRQRGERDRERLPACRPAACTAPCPAPAARPCRKSTSSCALSPARVNVSSTGAPKVDVPAT